MKVLIVFNHPAPYKVNLFNLLNKDMDLDVIFERKKASNRVDDFYKDNVYDFNHIFLKRGAFGEEQSNTGELVKYLKVHAKEYDLIIMNGYSRLTEMRAIRYLNKNHIPFTLYINGGTIKKECFIKRKIKTKYISSASSYLSPSREADEYLIYYGAKEDKIYHYSNSTVFEKQLVDHPLNKKEKEALREKLNLPIGTLFISASQFIERKNILFLLECFKGLDEKLLLVGAGPLKEAYVNFIRDNNMNNVIMMDYLPSEQLFELIRACDAFITLSKEDIYGHTINESFAQGVPVISSQNVVSAHKLIKENVNGYIVDLNDKESIIDKIKHIRGDMGDEALKTARENTFEVMAKQQVEIIKKLAK